MQYVGIDLHRKFSQVHVYDDQTVKGGCHQKQYFNYL